MRATRLLLAGFILALASLAGPLAAQTGTLVGTVVGVEDGRPLAGVVIQVVAASGAEFGTLSNDVGRFTVGNLSPGAYSVVASVLGREAARQDGVQVRDGAAATVELRLAIRPALEERLVVSAPERRAQPYLKTPGTVGIVQSREIEEQPALSPVDHLRTVAGVDMIQYGLQSSNVVTRGFNNLFSGALYTLTDYRIASVPSLRVNLLHMEPSTNEDLERMEVVLGPGAALYGPNTANGVLHMMTRSPLDHPGTRVSVTGGERDLLKGSFRSAQRITPNLGFKLSGHYLSANEWEFIDPVEQAARDSAIQNPAACLANWLGGGVPIEEAQLRCERVGRRDFGVERWSVDGRADWRLGSGWTAVFSSGLARVVNGIELTGVGAGQARNWGKYYVQARASRGRLFGQVYMNGSDAGDTFLLQTGGSIIDRSRLLVGQLQHGVSFGNRQDFTYGIDVLRTMPESEGTINGRYEDDDQVTEVGGYLHSETGLTDRLNLVLAGRVDHTSSLEDPVFSPRAGLVFTPADRYSFYATYNRAFETPSTLNMFLDIYGGGVPDPSLARIGYGLRAQGPGFDGLDLVDEAGLPHGMRSPFNFADRGALLPMDPQTLWSMGVVALRVLGRIDDATAADLMALDASGLGINALDPNTREITSLADAAIRDVPRVEESRQTTYEVGFKGVMGDDRLLLAADVWFTEKSNFVSPLLPQTPFLMVEGTSTVQMLVPYFMSQGFPQQEATDSAIALVQGSPAVVGDGVAEIPLAVASSADVAAFGADVLATYRNFGRVSLWGADLSATLFAGGGWSLGLNASLVSDDHFNVDLDGVNQIVALNAPKLKGNATVGFLDIERGFSAETRFRYHDGFPANSAGYVGLACAGVSGSGDCVDSALLTDVTLGYRVPGLRTATVQLTVQNLFDHAYRSFVRVPAIGRMALLRVTYDF
jgi:outer membrane receptor for ferrienterochelin and colicins